MTFNRDELLCMTNEDLAQLISLAKDVVEERRKKEILQLTENFLKAWRELERRGVDVILDGCYYNPDNAEFDY